MEERRKYERFDFRLPGKIEVVSAGKQEVLDLLTSDVSPGGAFFHTAKPIAEGAGVKVRLVVGSERIKEMTGGGQGLIKVGGTVVRSGPTGMAICFDAKYQIVPLGSG